jgi:hypothetical protein
VELHQYLNSDLQDVPEAPPLDLNAILSSSPTSKSERRRSLPTTMSMLSLSSVFTITSPQHEITEFQLRRRKAAKLTQFFGVDYRDLIQDVLESIEKGVDEDRNRGTLKPSEADVRSPFITMLYL